MDAGFVWTEPHSRRIKVKLTVQAEVMNGAILQQTFVVEYVVEPHMCMDCTRANTNSSVWTACAQVRLSLCCFTDAVHVHHDPYIQDLSRACFSSSMSSECAPEQAPE